MKLDVKKYLYDSVEVFVKKSKIIKLSEEATSAQDMQRLLVSVLQQVAKGDQREKVIGEPAPVPRVFGEHPSIPGVFGMMENQGIIWALLNYISPQLLNTAKEILGADVILGLARDLPPGELQRRYQRMASIMQARGFALQQYDVKKWESLVRNLFATLGHKIEGYTAERLPYFNQETEKHLAEIVKLGPDVMFLMVMFAPNMLDKLLPAAPGATGTTLRGSLSVALTHLYGTLGSIPDPITGEPAISDPISMSQVWLDALSKYGWSGYSVGEIMQIMGELATRGILVQELATAPPHIQRLISGDEGKQLLEPAIRLYKTSEAQKHLETTRSYATAIGNTQSLLADLYRGRQNIGVKDAFNFLDFVTLGSWTSLPPERINAIISEVYSVYNTYGTSPKFWANLSNMLAKNLDKFTGTKEFAPYLANAAVRYLLHQVSRGTPPSAFQGTLNESMHQAIALYTRGLKSQIVNMAGAILSVADAYRESGSSINPSAPFWQLVDALQNGRLGVGNISLSYITPQALEAIAVSSGIDPGTIRSQMMMRDHNIRRFVALGQPALSIIARAQTNESAKVLSALSFSNPILRSIPQHVLFDAVMQASQISITAKTATKDPIAGGPGSIAAHTARLLAANGYIPQESVGTVAASLTPILSQIDTLTGVRGLSTFNYLALSRKSLVDPNDPITRKIAEGVVELTRDSDETRRAGLVERLVDAFNKVPKHQSTPDIILDYIREVFVAIKYKPPTQEEIDEIAKALTGQGSVPLPKNPLRVPAPSRLTQPPLQQPPAPAKPDQDKPTQDQQKTDQKPDQQKTDQKPQGVSLDQSKQTDKSFAKLDIFPESISKKDQIKPDLDLIAKVPGSPETGKDKFDSTLRESRPKQDIDYMLANARLPSSQESKGQIDQKIDTNITAIKLPETPKLELPKSKSDIDQVKFARVSPRNLERHRYEEDFKILPIREYRKQDEDKTQKQQPPKQQHRVNTQNIDNQEYSKALSEFMMMPKDKELSSIHSVN